MGTHAAPGTRFQIELHGLIEFAFKELKQFFSGALVHYI